MTPSRAKVGVLGGTFDHLHIGHRRLLDEAFRRAERVGIGLTTPQYLQTHAKRASTRIQPFRARRARLESYLRSRYPSSRWWIVPLEDGVGGALAPDVELLVASDDTREGARRINHLRRQKGLRPVRTELVPIARADDLLPVSSTRIRLGVITAEGRRRRPVRLARRAGLPLAAQRQLERAFRAGFPQRTRLKWIERGAIPARPTWAAVRADALAVRGDADYGVGVTRASRPPRAGVVYRLAVVDEGGRLDAGRTAGRRTRSIGAQVRATLSARRRAWVGTPFRRRARG